MILWLVVVVARKVAKFQIKLLLKVSEGLWIGGCELMAYQQLI